MPAEAVKAPRENRESCEIHGRYRHCKRGGARKDESRSLAKAEKAVREAVDAPVRRTAHFLNYARACKYGSWLYLLRKNGRSIPIFRVMLRPFFILLVRFGDPV